MKVSQIAGFLGCGKTTLLLELSRKLTQEKDYRVALVVNEIGEIPVDGKVLKESGLRVKDIGGGCICCEVASTFAKTVYQLSRDFEPDYILVEPTGVAVPHQVKKVAKMSGRDAKISVGPAIVLFDATRPRELLDMDKLGQLVSSQLKEADIVAISKVDCVDSEAQDAAAKQIRSINQEAEIITISSYSGIGLEQIIERILA